MACLILWHKDHFGENLHEKCSWNYVPSQSQWLQSFLRCKLLYSLCKSDLFRIHLCHGNSGGASATIMLQLSSNDLIKIKLLRKPRIRDVCNDRQTLLAYRHLLLLFLFCLHALCWVFEGNW